jgi:hypothetical protein
LPPGPSIVEVAPVDEEALAPPAQLCQGPRPAWAGRQRPALLGTAPRPSRVRCRAQVFPNPPLCTSSISSAPPCCQSFQAETPWFFGSCREKGQGTRKMRPSRRTGVGVFWLVWAPPNKQSLPAPFPYQHSVVRASLCARQVTSKRSIKVVGRQRLCNSSSLGDGTRGKGNHQRRYQNRSYKGVDL